MKKIKNWIAALTIIALAGGVLFTAMTPQMVAAAPSCNRGFLGFPAWYRYLTNTDCSLKSPDDVGGLSNFIWLIAMNIVEIAAVAVVYITAILIMYGGFLFMTSQGTPDGAVQGRKTIINACVGLVISLGAIAAVRLMANIIK